MLFFESIPKLQDHLKKLRTQNKSTGFVPTMGALHEGHLSLVRKAKEENDIAICSIYVNPTQFNNAGDLEKYPRTLEKDAEMLKSVGCDILFTPTNEMMYPEPGLLRFSFGKLEEVMEGQFRQGHFNGVATVVSKFFNIVQPDSAYFGQKDLQQYLIIRQLVSDLSFPVRLVRYPIVREADGLAMSSRNQRLTTEQRAISPKLYEVLKMAEGCIPGYTPAQIKQKVEESLASVEGINLEYFEIVHGYTLETINNFKKDEPVALCIAAFLGEVRLIDNLYIERLD